MLLAKFDGHLLATFAVVVQKSFWLTFLDMR